MSTTTDPDRDYVEHVRKQMPDRRQMTRGPQERRQRHVAATKERVTIRLDADVLRSFRELTGHPDGKGYQTLVNQALRDWLMAQGLNELVREEVRRALQESLSEETSRASGH